MEVLKTAHGRILMQSLFYDQGEFSGFAQFQFFDQAYQFKNTTVVEQRFQFYCIESTPINMKVV